MGVSEELPKFLSNRATMELRHILVENEIDCLAFEQKMGSQ